MPIISSWPSLFSDVSARLAVDEFLWSLKLGLLWKSGEKVKTWSKSWKTIGDLTWRSRYFFFLFLPATLNRLTSVLFEWNGIRMLEEPRRYKHYMNAQQCYFIVHCLSYFSLYCYTNWRFLCYEDQQILIFNDILRFIFWRKFVFRSTRYGHRLEVNE